MTNSQTATQYTSKDGYYPLRTYLSRFYLVYPKIVEVLKAKYLLTKLGGVYSRRWFYHIDNQAEIDRVANECQKAFDKETKFNRGEFVTLDYTCKGLGITESELLAQIGCKVIGEYVYILKSEYNILYKKYTNMTTLKTFIEESGLYIDYIPQTIHKALIKNKIALCTRKGKWCFATSDSAKVREVLYTLERKKKIVHPAYFNNTCLLADVLGYKVPVFDKALESKVQSGYTRLLVKADGVSPLRPIILEYIAKHGHKITWWMKKIKIAAKHLLSNHSRHWFYPADKHDELIAILDGCVKLMKRQKYYKSRVPDGVVPINGITAQYGLGRGTLSKMITLYNKNGVFYTTPKDYATIVNMFDGLIAWRAYLSESRISTRHPQVFYKGCLVKAGIEFKMFSAMWYFNKSDLEKVNQLIKGYIENVKSTRAIKGN